MGNLRYTNLASEAADEDALAQLALDVRWSWNHSTDELWQRLNPDLWDLTHNPWIVLQTVSRERLESVTSDAGFQSLLGELSQAQQNEREQATWFQQSYAQSPLKTVAYFSMEYMLSEALPIYSGGLGNVAGDQLKAANDLGVPVVGVGLLYQQGYFRQQIDENGNQHALCTRSTIPANCPSSLCGTQNGDWLRITLRMPGLIAVAADLGSAGGPERNCTCSTPTIRRIFRSIAASRVNCMAEVRICGCGRSWCWGSADGGCCARWGFSRRCAI